MASQADWAQFIAASLRLAASWGPLPPGWQMTVDPASGRFYFFNTATGVVQWDRPGVAGTGAAPAPSPCSAAATSHAAGSSASADADAAGARPAVQAVQAVVQAAQDSPAVLRGPAKHLQQHEPAAKAPEGQQPAAWTPEDDKTLQAVHAEVFAKGGAKAGVLWGVVAERMGRTEVDVKARFLKRKGIGQSYYCEHKTSSGNAKQRGKCKVFPAVHAPCLQFSACPCVHIASQRTRDLPARFPQRHFPPSHWF